MGLGDRSGTLLRSVRFRKKASDVSDRKLGDSARDSGHWRQAELAYKRHLLNVPGDAAIWVQLGHAIKEQGEFAGAVEAYQQALTLRPHDQDCRTHLAHALKRSGDAAEAIRSFTQLFAGTGGREPYNEAVQLWGRDACEVAAVRETRKIPGDVVFIELDDLLGFLEAHKTVSGIQRVQLGVIEHVLAQPASSRQYVFVLNEMNALYLWRLRFDDIQAILSCLQGDAVDHDTLRALVRAARRNAEAVLAQSGQTYVVLGAFWGFGAVATRYAKWKHAGVAVGALVYDLIPITHPEYCDEELAHDFRLSFDDGLAIFDFILAISEFSAEEVRRYLKRLALPPRPVVAVPLAHSAGALPQPHSKVSHHIATAQRAGVPRISGDGSAPVSLASSQNTSLTNLRGRPFAMMVSTIEARKNHNYLVSAWKHFVDEGLDPPDLVFVGRPGWRVSSMMEMLATTRYLEGRVHILHDLSDKELTKLYDDCLFTLFPSFVEGWGLPVGESLARGKPCVASSTSSIPEVGGDLIDYIDPLNLRDGIEVIRRMAFDVEYRKQRSEEVRARFKVRSWKQVSTELLHHVDEFRRTLPVNTKPEVLFPSQTIFRIGDFALGHRLPDDYAKTPLRSMLVKGWSGVEAPGCWMVGRQGELQFRSELPSATPIVAYIELYAHCADKNSLEVKVGAAVKMGQDSGAPDDHEYALAKLPNSEMPKSGHFSVVAYGVIGSDGLVRVTFTPLVPPKAHSGRQGDLAMGLSSICYCKSSDPEARLALVERFLVKQSSRIFPIILDQGTLPLKN